MAANGRCSEIERMNAALEVMRQRLALAEETVINKRENYKRLRDDYTVLMGKFQNLEAEIIYSRVDSEAKENEINGLHQVIEHLQKRLMDFNVPPSPWTKTNFNIYVLFFFFCSHML